MEDFFSNHYMLIGTSIGLLVGIFGLVWTVLERRLIVSRKHVTGVSGFTSAMVGALLCAASAYVATDRIIYFIIVIAAFIAVYALICRFVEKKEYPPEERYTKE